MLGTKPLSAACKENALPVLFSLLPNSVFFKNVKEFRSVHYFSAYLLLSVHFSTNSDMSKNGGFAGVKLR